MRCCWLLALSLVLATPARAGVDPLLKYHPRSGDLPDLTVVEGSHQAGAGEGLTAIYDGGYERFVKAGVTRASQQYYEIRDRSVELCIHAMKSAAAARTFFAALCKDTKAKVEPLALGRRAGTICVAAAEGSAYGYLAVQGFVLSSSVDKPDADAARALLRAAGERIAGKAAAKKPRGEKKPVRRSPASPGGGKRK